MLVNQGKQITQVTVGNRTVTEIYKGSTLLFKLGFEPITFTNSTTWVVPAGIKKIKVDCVGAQGRSPNTTGGLGGRVQCILSVTPKQTLYIIVGKQDRINNYNASDIRTSENDLYSRLVVAGGGGNGTSGIAKTPGAAGGGLTGATAGSAYYYSGGTGGSQTAGGSRNGTFGYGGSGGGGGTGGAGWYGGGGGDSGLVKKVGTCSAGGGGGSSYTNPDLCTNVEHTQGFKSGDGYITISMV